MMKIDLQHKKNQERALRSPFFMRKDWKMTCIFSGSKYIKGLTDGEMVEWFKAAVLKTAEAQASASSNLALSAIFFALIQGKKYEA